MSERCCYCGQFIHITPETDTAVRFGHSGDMDPPDPVWWCDECARKAEEHAVETGSIRGYWVPPKWEARAAERLGLRRAGPKGAAWGRWCKTLPDGYEWHNEPEAPCCGHAPCRCAALGG